jgi:transposase
MTPIELPFALPGFEVDEVQEHPDVIEIVAHSVATAAICPACQRCSRCVHSYYRRSAADLPVADRSVRLTLTVRRFRCLNQHCAKVTFAERLPELLALHRQRTGRLETALGAVALAVGGQAGQTLAGKLHMSASRDTLLRLIRRTSDMPMDELVVLGVDDWAQQRGRVYGTILVDLERRRAVDLLPDRTAETLAQWLQAHPRVQTVARDRSGEYARGISLGAPQAQQVADRWHLLVNLREALEKLLDRLRPELTAGGLTKTPEKPGEIHMIRRRHRGRTDMAARDGRRARALALHEKIHRLRQVGHTICAIARQMKLSRTTVYRYLSVSALPERSARRRRASILDPFVDYLSQRWTAGCRNASQLWREIKQQGYPGTRRQVAQWVYERREQPGQTTPHKYLQRGSRSVDQFITRHEAADRTPLPAARRLVWLFLKPSDHLQPEELSLRDELLTHPVLAQAHKLAYDFQRIVRQRQANSLDAWCAACEESSIPELANLAAGMRPDPAVKAACGSKWSNGQTEGQINRLKMLKRQMYGRANLDLLRLRFLYST